MALARLLLCGVLIACTSCNSIAPKENTPKNKTESGFKPATPDKIEDFATPDKLKALDIQEAFQYRIGPGDRISIQVWRRAELSQEGIVVSPDGLLSVPRIGNIQVLGKTVSEVQHLVTTRLELLYIEPEVTIRVLDFQNNKAFVLGKVSKPGVVNFPGRGTLLEALALAGGIPDQSKNALLSRCAIIRGNDIVIWIDLQDLLRNGNMTLNAPIRNNDVIYVPNASEEMIYVLGEVQTPGAILLKSDMTVLKAVMMAGGINKNSDPEKVFVIRQQNTKGEVTRVNLKKLIEKGDFSQNFTLMPNDIVYISPGGMTKLNYSLEKIMPSVQVLNLGFSKSSFIYGGP
ncbi:MAG: sugar transporter [Chlorobiaceae bacterium]|nr:sugar transporter [Chlorobiaceae bacterium]